MSAAEASMSGIVTDSTTGDPLSGMSVAIFNNSTNKKSTGTTDSSGAYSIQSIPVGTYNVEVEGDDYDANNLDDLSLPAGNTVKNFSMSKSGFSGSESGSESDSESTIVLITGTVQSGGITETNAKGTTFVMLPVTNVSGATVTVTNTITGAVLGTTTSDSNGFFAIEVPLVSDVITASKDGTPYATVNLKYAVQ